LLLMSVCQGVKVQQPLQQRGADAAVSGGFSSGQPPVLQLPEGFPAELLEGTVEGQQLQVQLSERAIAGDTTYPSHASPYSPGGASPEGSTPPTTLVEVASCFRLTAAHHARLLHSVLVPLAMQHADLDLARTIDGTCLEQLGVPLLPESAADSELKEWTPMSTSAIINTAASQPDELPADSSLAHPEKQQKTAVVSALLQCMLQQPSTFVMSDPLPCGNAAVPWDESSVYVSSSSAPRPVAQEQQQQSGVLRQRLASLLKRKSKGPVGSGPSSGSAADASEALDNSVTDLTCLRDLIMTLLEVSELQLIAPNRSANLLLEI
jgi:hypothetical protein